MIQVLCRVFCCSDKVADWSRGLKECSRFFVLEDTAVKQAFSCSGFLFFKFETSLRISTFFFTIFFASSHLTPASRKKNILEIWKDSDRNDFNAMVSTTFAYICF